MRFSFLVFLAVCPLPAADLKPVNHPLRTAEGLTRRGTALTAVKWKHRDCLRMADEQGSSEIALFNSYKFRNGTIEIDVAAQPLPSAGEGARGFVGLAFRVESERHYEGIYIRPTNGRADDQLRRNHATQYISEPEYPWDRLRKETPGVYESYADMEPGVWTHLRVVVQGLRAELFVGKAPQPVLIVKDLKKGDTEGTVALWVGSGSEAFFSNLKITPR